MLSLLAETVVNLPEAPIPNSVPSWLLIVLGTLAMTTTGGIIWLVKYIVSKTLPKMTSDFTALTTQLMNQFVTEMSNARNSFAAWSESKEKSCVAERAEQRLDFKNEIHAMGEQCHQAHAVLLQESHRIIEKNTEAHKENTIATRAMEGTMRSVKDKLDHVDKRPRA